MTTKIQWTEETWNPVRGCSIVSKGCTNCYAMKQAHRFSGPGGPYEGLTKNTKGGAVWTDQIKLVPDALDTPFRWRHPKRIFVNSMSDLFHEGVPDNFILDVFDVMRQCANGYAVKLNRLVPHHTFQILTKRPQRMRDFTLRLRFENELYLADSPKDKGFNPMPAMRNVWLGVSTEDQKTFDERVELLGQAAAAVRWVSAEPLLEEIDFGNAFDDVEHNPPYGQYGKIHWVVIGGESGPGARTFDVEWARQMIRQCELSNTPVFLKQLGSRPYAEQPSLKKNFPFRYKPKWSDDELGQAWVQLVDGKGGDMTEWPEDLRVRQYPVPA